MTSNVHNAGIAHAALKTGGVPLCSNRRAHMSLAIADFRRDTYQCKRCASKLAAMDARAAAKLNKETER